MQIKSEWYRINHLHQGSALTRASITASDSLKRSWSNMWETKKTKAIANICISWFSVDEASQTSQDVSNA